MDYENSYCKRSYTLFFKIAIQVFNWPHERKLLWNHMVSNLGIQLLDCLSWFCPGRNCSETPIPTRFYTQKMVPNLVYTAMIFSQHQLWRNLKHHFPKRRKHHEVLLYISTYIFPSLSIKFSDPWHKIPAKNHSNLAGTCRELGNDSQSNLSRIYNFFHVLSFLESIISESHQPASKMWVSRMFGPSFLQTSRYCIRFQEKVI